MAGLHASWGYTGFFLVGASRFSRLFCYVSFSAGSDWPVAQSDGCFCESCYDRLCSVAIVIWCVSPDAGFVPHFKLKAAFNCLFLCFLIKQG